MSVPSQDSERPCIYALELKSLPLVTLADFDILFRPFGLLSLNDFVLHYSAFHSVDYWYTR
jgi:hypothetical protein